MEKLTKYVPQLTWLRGIAALLVIVSHVTRATETPYSSADIGANSIILRISDLGAFAVTLFLALSGATLYISHGKSLATNTIVPFLIKRVLRIYPAYIFSLAAFMISEPITRYLYGDKMHTWMDAAIADYSLQDIWQHLLLIHDLIGKPFVINPVYWSLPVEFRYYLLFPVALFLLRTGGIKWLIIFSAAVTALINVPIISPAIPHFFWLCSSFFGGMLVAHIVHGQATSRVTAPALLGICIVATSSIWNFRQLLPHLPIMGNINTYNIALSIATVYLALRSDLSWVSKHTAQALSFLGNISYSVYLLHFMALTFAFIACVRLEVHGDAKAAFILITTLAITIPASYLSYRFIELPCIRISKKSAFRDYFTGRNSQSNL